MASERSLSEVMKELRHAIRLYLAERLLSLAFDVMPTPEKAELAQAIGPIHMIWIKRYENR